MRYLRGLEAHLIYFLAFVPFSRLLFASQIPDALKLAKKDRLRAVFLDAGFACESVKINVGQIFKLMSTGTNVKTIQAMPR